MNTKFISLLLITLTLATNAVPASYPDTKSATLELFNAVQNNNVKLANCLIKKHEANVNGLRLHPDRKTPLHIAAENGHDELVTLLLKKGAAINDTDSFCCRPLHYAAKNGHTKCVKILIAKDADVDRTDDYGKTPLYYAIEQGHKDCVKVLLAAGANPTTTPNQNDGYNWHPEQEKIKKMVLKYEKNKKV